MNKETLTIDETLHLYHFTLNEKKKKKKSFSIKMTKRINLFH
jgi:hypothetical protein